MKLFSIQYVNLSAERDVNKCDPVQKHSDHNREAI